MGLAPPHQPAAMLLLLRRAGRVRPRGRSEAGPPRGAGRGAGPQGSGVGAAGWGSRTPREEPVASLRPRGWHLSARGAREHRTSALRRGVRGSGGVFFGHRGKEGSIEEWLPDWPPSVQIFPAP